MLRKISSEKDIDEYINHFDKLDKKEKESEFIGKVKFQEIIIIMNYFFFIEF